MNEPHDRPSIWAGLLVSALLASVAPQPSAADAQAPGAQIRFSEVPASKELLSRLRQGGYVLYLRHGDTDNTRADRYPAVDLADCSTQRPLSAAGRKIAAQVGAYLREARIPISDVSVSPLCRAKDTAAIAFPHLKPTVDNELMYTANLTDEQKKPIIANTRRLLSAPVAPGSNRLIIAHAPNLMDLIAYFPKEATLVVFKPGGSAGFNYIASISPGLWPNLLR